jgi:hypothetical protein
MCMACCYGESVVGKVITKTLRPQTLDLFLNLQTGNSKSKKFISVTLQQNGSPLHLYLRIRHASNGIFHNTRCGASLQVT